MQKRFWMRERILQIVLPRRCPVCGEITLPDSPYICRECRSRWRVIGEPWCVRCGKELTREEQEFCSDCRRYPRSFEQGCGLLVYNSAAKHFLSQVKYHNQRNLLDWPAEELYRQRRRLLEQWQPQVLIPVPVHRRKLQSRGFNQAQEIAERLSPFLNIPVDTKTLVRIRRTLPQKELNPLQRLHNLEQAFAVRGESVPWKRVLLVDDIYTTGSTMEACSRVLKKAGAENVYCISMAIGGGMS